MGRFRHRPAIPLTLLALVVAASLTGCSAKQEVSVNRKENLPGTVTKTGSYRVRPRDEPDYFEDELRELEYELYIKESHELRACENSRWTCEWHPTMNNNWHDDVLCSKGAQLDRPELLTDWSFVTQEDMMIAAKEYEDWLNGE